MRHWWKIIVFDNCLKWLRISIYIVQDYDKLVYTNYFVLEFKGIQNQLRDLDFHEMF